MPKRFNVKILFTWVLDWRFIAAIALLVTVLLLRR